MLRRTMSNNLELVSIPFMQCPAKTYVTKDGRVIPGRGVFEHCTIVGEVARELVSRFPVGIRQRLFPPDVPLVAAAHDVGKVSPCFFEKIRTSCEPECKTLPALGNIDSQLEAQWG